MSAHKMYDIGSSLDIGNPLKKVSIAHMSANDRIGVLTVQCMVPSPKECGQSLVTSERKHLMRAALELFINAKGLKYEIINSHLALAEHSGGDTAESSVTEEKSHYVARVQAYTGSGRPSNPHKFHRTFIRTGQREGPQWRWISKPETLQPRLDAPQSSVLSAKFPGHEQSSQPVYHDLHVAFSFSMQFPTIGGIVRCAEQCTDDIQALQSRDIINELLSRDSKDLLSSVDAEFHGLRVLRGVARSLHAQEQELVIAEVPCKKLSFKAQSVASFMQEYLGGAASLPITDIARLTEKPLKGVEVKVLGGQGSPIRRIVGIASQDASQLSAKPLGAHPDQTLAQYYSSKGVNLLTPSLPCINVGTIKSALFVPAELCLIAPGQPFSGALSPALQSELSSLKLSSSVVQIEGQPDRVPDQQDLIAATPVSRLKPNKSILTAQKPSAKAANQFKVVFVAVGSEIAEKRLYQDFATDLTTKVTSYNVGIVEQETIVLQHLGDVQSPKIWEHNLARHASDTDGRQVIFVIGHSDSVAKSATERIIKKICDQRLGAQCLFISVSDLQNAAYGRRSRSVTHFAGQQLSRIFACNPDAVEPKQLSVGLHITPLSRPQSGERAKRSVDECWYLVAFSARASIGSHDYYHKVVLRKVMAGGALDLNVLFKAFLQQITSGRDMTLDRITLFRSGAIVPLPSPAQESVSKHAAADGISGMLPHNVAPSVPSSVFNGSGSSTQPASAQSDTFDHAETATTAATSIESNEMLNGVDHEHQKTQQSKPMPSKFETLAQEATGFAQMLQGISADAELVYYHAAENPSFRLPDSALVNITSNSNHDADSPFGQPLLFLHDKKLLGSHDALGVLSATKHLHNQPLMKLTIIRQADDRGLGRLSAGQELLDKWQREGSKRTIRTRRVTRPRDHSIPHTPSRNASGLLGMASPRVGMFSPEHTEADADLPLRNVFETPRQSSVGSVSTVKGGATIPARDRMLVSESELQLLTEAFHDDLLKLHNTKWPIPTYLAQKASKRAIVNMESDCWNEDIPTAPYKLHEAHEKLKGTLYFLT
ncbi:protein argonaute 2 [Teratosphaeria destructans]|uniref:Protein argonaute 2 n=1 Tax=Teratosphaeria destructans TaxID=418781 RepID=A0A9W7T0U8_9PEZI|nr:protein argonaute 2 [Teratosphaeria destructans]